MAGGGAVTALRILFPRTRKPDAKVNMMWQQSDGGTQFTTGGGVLTGCKVPIC
jgi:hypothetical protein